MRRRGERDALGEEEKKREDALNFSIRVILDGVRMGNNQDGVMCGGDSTVISKVTNTFKII